jgi:hypothetical protein
VGQEETLKETPAIPQARVLSGFSPDLSETPFLIGMPVKKSTNTI